MKKLINLIILLFLIVVSVYSRGNPDMIHEFDFEYSQIENLEIQGELFNIIIEGKDIPNVTGKIKTSNKNYMLYHKQEGDTLIIWSKRSWWPFLSFAGKHTLFLEVPVSTNIAIDNSSGGVDVKNITSEFVNIKTSSANIIAENIRANQGFKSSSGNIHLREAISPGEISLKASSGYIKIETVEADLKVHNASGTMKIDNANGKKILSSSSGDIKVASSYGNIESHSSSGKHKYIDISGNIKAKTSSGDIIIEDDKGSLELSTSSGSIRGKNINITDDSSFKTSSGSISIDYTNTNEDFTFDLTSSSGNLKAGSTKARKKLQSGNGFITIMGKSSSGNQAYE